MSDAPRGLVRQALSTHAETTKYHTFWPRFGALVIDVLVVLPVVSLGEFLMRPDRDLSIAVAGAVLASFVPLFYRTLMHARYGQTVGKRVAGVKVLDASETKAPSLGKCIVRDLPDYLVAALTVFHVISLFRLGRFQPDQPDTSTFGQALDLGYITWLFADGMVLAANFHRRALHDWLAGTVVVKCPRKRRKPAVKA
jgi:uncharacterized RDD family membrane protein YckC